MKRIIITLVLASLMPLGMANAAGPATPQKVFDMVIMAVQAMEVMGAPETIKEIQNPKGDFVDGEIYPISADCETGKCLAHPMAPHLVGKNVDMLTVKDKKGTPFFARLCEIAAGKNGGWMEYWRPETGREDPIEEAGLCIQNHDQWQRVHDYFRIV